MTCSYLCCSHLRLFVKMVLIKSNSVTFHTFLFDAEALPFQKEPINDINQQLSTTIVTKGTFFKLVTLLLR